MRKHYLGIIAALGIIFALSTISDNGAYAFKKNEVNLLVKKINGTWKVVDAADSSKTSVKAKRGYKITWTAEGTDVYFQFMDDKLVGKFKNALKDGKSISLNIGPNAKTGDNSYAVFCTADMEFAEGNSPPVIIVEND